MKTNLEIMVNGKRQDCMIKSINKVQHKENGLVDWVDDTSDLPIARVKGFVLEVKIYVSDSEEQNASILYLSPYSIKQLYQAISEIESFEGEELIQD